jgi:putative membrane protein
MRRRLLRLAGLTAALAWALVTAAPLMAQPAPAPSNVETFLRLAYSSTVLQARAAELAATRDTRPEVRAFARRMVEFRREQGAKLLAVARERQLAVPPVPEFEHRIVLENLEPLDFLALSRRYAEVQVQALEQEVQGYAGGEGSPDEWVRTVARDTRPRLQQLLEEARQVRQAIGP